VSEQARHDAAPTPAQPPSSRDRLYPIRVGAVLWPQGASWVQLAHAAQVADSAGVDSLWTWDHLYPIVGATTQPIFEGWSVLAGLAGRTDRASLGLMVGANTFRNPGLVAKSAVSLDHISGGRARLGLGGAWFEAEHLAHGLEFGSSVGERLDWLDESAAAIVAVLRGDSVTSPVGGHYHFSDLRQAPGPVKGRGSLPLMIGGSGERKTLRTVALFADAWNTGGGPLDRLRHLLDVLHRHCDDVGRNPANIELTANHNICIRDDPATARRAWMESFEANGERYEADEGWDWFGPPDLIAERWRPLLDIGFRHAIAEVPAPYDLETLARLPEVRALMEPGLGEESH
jgi:alkanesulfonate monooxygenase SsuD/methylene tetrahydromethanopterin reductase-like flavin-dependent oxidoreductase (luciferase family)